MKTQLEQAKQLIKDKQYEDAIPLLEELLPETKTESAKMEIFEQLAVCYTNTGDFEQAEELLHTVSELAILTQDSPQLIRARLSLSFVAIQRREYQVALHHVCRAYATYEILTEKPEDLYTKILLQSATISYYRGRPDISTEIFTEIMQHHHHLLEPDIAQRIEHRLTVLNIRDENWQESVQQLLQCAKEYARREEWQYVGETHAELSEIFLRFHEEDQAVFHANQALEFLPNVHQSSGKAHQVLASISLKKGQDGWKEHMQTAVHVFLQLSLFWELDEVFLTLSHSLTEQGKWEEAYRMLEEWKSNVLNHLQERGIVL